MECAEIKTKLQPYLEDLLPSEERLPVRSHLRECPSCRSHSLNLGTFASDLKRMTNIPIPFSLSKEVLDQLNPTASSSTAPQKKRFPVVPFVLFSLIVTGITVCGVFLWQYGKDFRVEDLKYKEPPAASPKSAWLRPEDIPEPASIDDGNLFAPSPTHDQNEVHMEMKMEKSGAANSVTSLAPMHWSLGLKKNQTRESLKEQIKSLDAESIFQTDQYMVLSLDRRQLEELARILEGRPDIRLQEGLRSRDVQRLPKSESQTQVSLLLTDFNKEQRGEDAENFAYWDLRFLMQNSHVLHQRILDSGLRFVVDSPQNWILQISGRDYRHLRFLISQIPGLEIKRMEGLGPEQIDEQDSIYVAMRVE